MARNVSQHVLLCLGGKVENKKKTNKKKIRLVQETHGYDQEMLVKLTLRLTL